MPNHYITIDSMHCTLVCDFSLKSYDLVLHYYSLRPILYCSAPAYLYTCACLALGGLLLACLHVRKIYVYLLVWGKYYSFHGQNSCSRQSGLHGQNSCSRQAGLHGQSSPVQGRPTSTVSYLTCIVQSDRSPAMSPEFPEWPTKLPCVKFEG